MVMQPRKPVEDFFTFILGAVLLSTGVFLFFNQVLVGSHGLGLGGPFAFRRGWGGGMLGYGWGGGFGGSGFGGGGFGGGLAPGSGFGLLLIPLTAGVCLLFALRNQRWGWFLVLASLAAMAAGVLQTLFVQFQPTTLWNLIMMLALVGSGGGLMFRALMGYDDGQD